MRTLIFLLILGPSLVYGADRLVCPSLSVAGTLRDDYLDRQLVRAGSETDRDKGAAEQLALARCVVRWCHAGPVEERRVAIARAALRQAGQVELVRPDVESLDRALNACQAPKPDYTRSIVAGVAAAVLGGAALWTGLEADSLQKTANDLSGATTPAECGGRDELDCADHQKTLVSESETYKLATGILIGTAVVSAGLAIWWLADPPMDRGTAAIAPLFGEREAGLQMLIRF